jgi:hypothetical protein
MWFRLAAFILCAIVALPVNAACPIAQAKSVPDCCHKGDSCPKPVKVQPCFACVADVRTTSVAPDHALPAVSPLAALPSVSFDAAAPPSLAGGRSADQRETYLRMRVLRL